MIDYLRASKAHIFVDALDDELMVQGDDHHHLTRVMRLNVDDHITAACDGSIREYVISNITREELSVMQVRDVQSVDEPRIDLYVSLFKMDRLENGILKAVESGATSITLGSTMRSSIVLDANKQEKLLRRINAIVKSAAMQSRRATLVPVAFVGDLVEHCAHLELPLVVCDPDGESQTPQAPVALLVGPEGGFEQQELESLVDSLGETAQWCMSPYILRAETAMALAPGLVAACS